MATLTGDGSELRSDAVSVVDSDDDDMYYVSKNEVNGNPIVTKALIGRDNFVSWKKSMEIALSARLKLSFIQGKFPKPDDRKGRAKWQRCNDVIMSWLISSVSEDIVGQILHAKDVMTAWNILHARFAGTNLARKSGLMKEANSLVQGDMDVATYHGKLSKIWQELDSIKKISACPADGNCVCCGEADDEKREDRVVQFLMGLNECYSMIRTQVFAMFKVPDMDVVFEMVTREESQRNATKTRYVEASAMFGQNNNYQHNQGSYQSAQGSNPYQNGQNNGSQMRQMSAGRGGFNKNKPRLFCTHCQMTGHSKENCYKLIGYPPGHKLHKGSESYKQGTNRKFSANNVNGTEETVTAAASNNNQSSGSFTTEQLNQIMNMIKSGGMNQSHTHMEMAGTAFSYNAAGTSYSYNAFSTLDCWIIDSGATCHFTYKPEMLSDIHDLKGDYGVILPNGERFTIKQSGNCKLQNGLVLFGVFLIPEFKVNLISVGKLIADSRYKVLFTDISCTIQDQHSKIILETGRPTDGLFSFDASNPKAQVCNHIVKKESSMADLWHRRLGHAPIDTINSILRQYSNKFQCKDSNYNCPVCPLAKQTKLPFSLRNYSADAPFSLIHGDVWGPFHVPTITGSQYFLTLVDDYSRATWTFLMKHKSDAADHIIGFFAMVRTQFSAAVKILRTDNGGEFFSDKLTLFLNLQGCIHQSSCPYTPEQNGVVERKHRHLLEVARALMFQSGLPKIFWGDSILTATYIINRLPTQLLKGKSPWEMLFNSVPSIDHMRIFGCLCYITTQAHQRDKFDHRALQCIFLGYPMGQKGYKTYCLTSHQVIVSRHITFREDIFPYKQSDKYSPATTVPLPILPVTDEALQFDDDDDSFILNNDDVDYASAEEDLNISGSSDDISPVAGPVINPNISVPVPRRSQRITNKPTWTKDYVCENIGKFTSPHHMKKFISYQKCSPGHKHFVMQISEIKEPTSFNKAVKDPKWMDAMNKEISALELNQTWAITDLPPGKTIVDCKWIYKIKFHADGIIERYKARLVARGFTQIEGLDFQETFAPVAKMTTVRCLLAVASARSWPVYQLDVNNAFLHGDLEEEVYMRLPTGFYQKEKSKGQVCKLLKSIYGLKQASRQWFAKFSEALLEFGFHKSMNDYSLFTLVRGTDFIILLVYVDDVILTGTSQSIIDEIKRYIHQKFQIKDLGALKYFLGLEVARSHTGIFLNQRKYVLELLEDNNLTECKPSRTPMDIKHKLSLSQAPLLDDPLQYRKMVGKLIYLTITRPDLSYSVHVLSQFMQKPTQDHLQAVQRVLRYLKGAPAQGLFFPANSDLSLKAFCDADWASCPLTRKSVTGYCVTLGGCAVSWKTKKQPVISRSSAESEYRSMAATCCELTWLVRLLADMRVPTTYSIPLHCDNKAAIHIAHNPVFHERTKHVELDCHLVRSHVCSKFIKPMHLSTTEQPADIFTKALSMDHLHYLCSKLGVSNFLHAAA
ncbi:unnamed protein product [Rhodiola kirilowii]